VDQILFKKWWLELRNVGSIWVKSDCARSPGVWTCSKMMSFLVLKALFTWQYVAATCDLAWSDTDQDAVGTAEQTRWSTTEPDWVRVVPPQGQSSSKGLERVGQSCGRWKRGEQYSSLFVFAGGALAHASTCCCLFFESSQIARPAEKLLL